MTTDTTGTARREEISPHSTDIRYSTFGFLHIHCYLCTVTCRSQLLHLQEDILSRPTHGALSGQQPAASPVPSLAGCRCQPTSPSHISVFSVSQGQLVTRQEGCAVAEGQFMYIISFGILSYIDPLLPKIQYEVLEWWSFFFFSWQMGYFKNKSLIIFISLFLFC